MKKMLLYGICVLTIIIITFSVLLASGSENKTNLEFLNSYGWEVDEEILEIENVYIPEVFDEVYINYNFIQKEAGLDLTEYKGKKAIRYTYRIINYPTNPKEEVRANIISYKGKPIAGDIMTVELNGFMHSLKFPEGE